MGAIPGYDIPPDEDDGIDKFWGRTDFDGD